MLKGITTLGRVRQSDTRGTRTHHPLAIVLGKQCVCESDQYGRGSGGEGGDFPQVFIKGTDRCMHIVIAQETGCEKIDSMHSQVDIRQGANMFRTTLR